MARLLSTSGARWMLAGAMLSGCSNDFAEFDFSGLGINTDASAEASRMGTGGDSPSGSGGDRNSGGTDSDAGDAATGGGGSGGGSGGLSEAGLPETGPTADGSPPEASADARPPDCDSLYGSAPGYVACSSSATTCTFAAETRNSNCEALCASFSGVCVDADDNGGQPCTPTTTADDCQTTRNTTICTCSR